MVLKEKEKVVQMRKEGIQEKEVEELSDTRQKMARGKLTSTAVNRPVLQQGSRSPGAQERSLARAAQVPTAAMQGP